MACIYSCTKYLKKINHHYWKRMQRLFCPWQRLCRVPHSANGTRQNFCALSKGGTRQRKVIVMAHRTLTDEHSTKIFFYFFKLYRVSLCRALGKEKNLKNSLPSAHNPGTRQRKKFFFENLFAECPSA
jgi:hypothetical protein